MRPVNAFVPSTPMQGLALMAIGMPGLSMSAVPGLGTEVVTPSTVTSTVVAVRMTSTSCHAPSASARPTRTRS